MRFFFQTYFLKTESQHLNYYFYYSFLKEEKIIVLKNVNMRMLKLSIKILERNSTFTSKSF